jgi:hypothetical protein
MNRTYFHFCLWIGQDIVYETNNRSEFEKMREVLRQSSWFKQLEDGFED